MLDISAGDAPAVEATSPRARGVGNEGSANAKSWKQQKKEAVLRKAGGGARVPAPTVEPTPEPLRVRRDSSEKGDSWAAKRAQSYLSTHGGPRSPRNSQEDMTQPAPTSPRAPGDLSWTEKRKEAYRRKYGLERTEAVAATDVTFSAVKFFVKLKSKAAAQQSAATDGSAAADGSAASTAPTRPASTRKPGELTWTQKRKEAYLRKYGKVRLEETTQADIAVTALSFASKLKVMSNRNK